MKRSEHRGRRAFVVESEYLLLRPVEGASPPVVLLLHGQGETAASFSARLALDPPGAALLYAGGPIPVEVSEKEGRRVGQAWYCFDGDQERFREALEEAESYLEALLDEARKKHEVDASRLVVAGYSMGAYVAGFFALRREPRPLGLALLSGRLKHEFLADRLEATRGLPVLLAHGRGDKHLAAGAAAEGRRKLEEAGARVSLLEYEGGHAPTPEVASRLEAWIAEVLRG